MENDRISRALYGAGGHARVVFSCARAAAQPFEFVFSDDPASAFEFAKRAGIAALPESAVRTSGTIFHLAIGANKARANIDKARAGLSWCSVTHPSAIVSEDCEIGEGAFIGAGAIIQCGARIGRHCIVNTGAIVEHDCLIDDYCHVAPGAVLSGEVRLGAGVLIGAGATVMKGRQVDDWISIGAGSAVVRDITGYSTAFGVPARGHRLKDRET